MASTGSPLLVAIVLGVCVLAPLVVSGADTIPPRAPSWGPTGTGVPSDTRILVLWSERMDWTSIPTAFSYTDGVGVYTQGGWTHDDAQNTSAFVPAVSFQPGTRYTVRFETTARDPAGNRLDQNGNGVGGELCDVGPPSFWDCLVWSFETAATPPRVLSTSPPNGGIATTNAPIIIRFSATMDIEAVEAAFSYGDGYSLYTIEDGTASWIATSVADDTIRFSPRIEFASGGTVTVNVDGSVARDAVGNLLDGDGDGTGGDDYAWAFTIAPDGTPPRVLTTTPVQGAGNVSISTTFRIVFSKAMETGSVEGALSLIGAGGPTLYGGDGTFSWRETRFPDDTVTFDTAPNLRAATTYRFVLNGSVASDREGRLLDGDGDGNATGSPADDFVLSLVTEAEDRTSPTVSTRTPAVGGVNVVPSTRIVVGFSEPMSRASVEASFSYTDGASTFTIADGSYGWNSASDVLTFQPTRSLSFGTMYTVTLNSSSARDEAGNPLNGGAPEIWSFTVAGQPDTTPPTVRWTSPFNGQKNVSRTARISIIFSEAMDRASVEDAMRISGGLSLRDFRWPNDATVEAATTAPMKYREPYRAFVLTGASDLGGNTLLQTVEIMFTTDPWRGRVWGRVADEANVGVEGALVRLNGLSVLTDDLGAFAFGTVEQGTYTLTVTHPGFTTFTTLLTIEPDPVGLGTITLRRPTVSVIDVALWVTVTAALLVVLGVVIWLRRRRSPGPGVTYETWKPAKVVVVEPRPPPPKNP